MDPSDQLPMAWWNDFWCTLHIDTVAELVVCASSQLVNQSKYSSLLETIFYSWTLFRNRYWCCTSMGYGMAGIENHSCSSTFWLLSFLISANDLHIVSQLQFQLISCCPAHQSLGKEQYCVDYSSSTTNPYLSLCQSSFIWSLLLLSQTKTWPCCSNPIVTSFSQTYQSFLENLLNNS